MTRVAVLQSNYIPWKGYFDIIHDVDLFVFYDDVQYTVRDWRHRNLIKTQAGAKWLSIPAGDNRNRLICEVELTDRRWQKSHWQTIVQFYSKTKFFKLYSDYFEHFYLNNVWTNLSDLNQALIKHIATEFLQIRTQFDDSRRYAAEGKKLDRMLSLLQQLGATQYVSGPSARSYIVPELFSAHGIEVVWKDYSRYPEYPQQFPPFTHQVSIIDILFNTGPNAPSYIWGSK